MSGSGWRLFFAAPLGERAAGSLWRLLAGLRERHPRARWMPPEQYHATLLFLGTTEPAQVERLAEAMRGVARARRSFRARLGQAGGRVGGRRGGVAWLRLSAGQTELSELSLAVDAACAAGAFADAAPRPHVTLARRVDRPLLAELRAADGLQLAWTIDRLVLYRSHTGPAGSRYEALDEAPLTG